MDRDTKDYAIEFGGYLATAAERHLNALGFPDVAETALNLRSAIYEFRKRVDRIVRHHDEPQQDL
jgi:hypothetical protein